MSNSSNIEKINDHTLERQQLVEPLKHYMATNANKELSLLLDGTGPRLTMQLPYLTGLGGESLNTFKQVHAFSGGIGAYCAYLGQTLGELRYELDYYFEGADREARATHRQSLSKYPILFKKFLQKKPLYTQFHYMEFFQTVLSDDFLQAPLDDIAPNFVPYIAHPDYFGPIGVLEENGFDRSQLSMYEVMAMGMKIPTFYSREKKVEFNTHYNNSYDATYTTGYWSMRNKLAASFESSITLTLFPRGLSRKSCVVDLSKGKKVNYYLLFDMLTLVLNIPNKRYRKDLQLAYL